MTANVTSWATATKYITDSTEDVLLLQESKATAQQVAKFRFAAKQSGYNLHSADATGPSQARSAGVIIAARRHLAIKPDSTVPHSSRCMSVTIDTRDLGRVTLASVYAHQGDTWGSDSPAASLMHNILTPLTEEGTRVIIGGDFNTGPYAMQQWLDQHGYPFHVTAQEQDTYLTAQGRSNIDYFIVSLGVLTRPKIVVLSG